MKESWVLLLLSPAERPEVLAFGCSILYNVLYKLYRNVKRGGNVRTAMLRTKADGILSSAGV